MLVLVVVVPVGRGVPVGGCWLFLVLFLVLVVGRRG